MHFFTVQTLAGEARDHRAAKRARRALFIALSACSQPSTVWRRRLNRALIGWHPFFVPPDLELDGGPRRVSQRRRAPALIRGPAPT